MPHVQTESNSVSKHIQSINNYSELTSKAEKQVEIGNVKSRRLNPDLLLLTGQSVDDEENMLHIQSENNQKIRKVDESQNKKLTESAVVARTEVKSSKMICSECHKGFITKQSLIQHIQIHLKNQQPSNSYYFSSEMYPYQCKMCDSGFSTKLNLDQHINSFHEKKKAPEQRKNNSKQK